MKLNIISPDDRHAIDHMQNLLLELRKEPQQVNWQKMAAHWMALRAYSDTPGREIPEAVIAAIPEDLRIPVFDAFLTVLAKCIPESARMAALKKG